MANLLERNRTYALDDSELEFIADHDKLAQGRYKGMGPAHYRLGCKVVYRGIAFPIISSPAFHHCAIMSGRFMQSG